MQKLQGVSLSVRTKMATPPVGTPGSSTAYKDRKKTVRQGVVVITGASSGLSLAAAKALAENGKWHVVMACRDFLKAAKAAKGAAMADGSYTIMHLDLASLDSVRQFVDNFRRARMPLDSLVCNTAIYRPTARTPTFTADGYEMSVGVNHLGHFLLVRLLLDDLQRSDYPFREQESEAVERSLRAGVRGQDGVLEAVERIRRPSGSGRSRRPSSGYAATPCAYICARERRF